jgi:hypothetical protein
MNRYLATGALLCLASDALLAAPLSQTPLKDLPFNVLVRERLRHEHAQVEGKQNANAWTLSSRIGISSKPISALPGWSGLVEWEDVTVLNDNDFNSTRNGRTRFATIADPEGFQLNQALIKYSGPKKTSVAVGRQKVNFDNQRWIGSVSFRQNEQTLDSLLLNFAGIDGLNATYAYVDQVNTIFFTKLDVEAHFINARYQFSDAAALVGYGYQFDWEKPSLAPFTRQDNRTLGARFTGFVPVAGYKLGYTAEYARQEGIKSAPASVKGDYYVAEVALDGKKGGVKAGYEVLGGNGSYGVQTSLSTLHLFNGYADVFLNTPTKGLKDAYVQGTYILPVGKGIKAELTYHDFGSDAGSVRYGSETDFYATYAFSPQWNAGLKIADYQAKAQTVDTRRVFAHVEFKL